MYNFWILHVEVSKETARLSNVNDAVNSYDNTASATWEWMWSIGGMIVTRKNWSTRRNRVPNITLSATKSHMRRRGTEPGLQLRQAGQQPVESWHNQHRRYGVPTAFFIRRKSPGRLRNVDWSIVAFQSYVIFHNVGEYLPVVTLKDLNTQTLHSVKSASW